MKILKKYRTKLSLLRGIIILFLFTFSVTQANKDIKALRTDNYPVSQSNIAINENLIYVVNSGSLETFILKNDKLKLIHELPVDYSPFHIVKCNDKLLLTNSPRTGSAFVVSIKNPEKPLVTDTLYIPGTYSSFFDGTDLVIQKLMGNWSWETERYSSLKKGENTSKTVPHKFWPLRLTGENKYAIKTLDSLFIYNHDDIENNTHSYATPWKEFSYPFSILSVNDSLFVTGNPSQKITFVNTNQKEPYTTIDFKAQGISISNNILAAHNGLTLKIFNIKNAKNPTLIEEEYINTISGIKLKNNKLFVTTTQGEFYYFSLKNNQLNKLASFKRKGCYENGYIINNQIVITSKLNKILKFDSFDLLSTPKIQDLPANLLFSQKYDSLLSIVGFKNNSEGFINSFYKLEGNSFKKLWTLHGKETNIQYEKSLGFYSLANDTLITYIKTQNTLKEKSRFAIKNTPYGELVKKGNYYYIFKRGSFCIYQKDTINRFKKVSETKLMFKDFPNYCFAGTLLIINNTNKNSGTYIYDTKNKKNIVLNCVKGDYGFLVYLPNTSHLYIINSQSIKRYLLVQQPKAALIKDIESFEYNEIVNVGVLDKRTEKLILFNKTNSKIFDPSLYTKSQ